MHEAVAAGAAMINDVCAFESENALATVAAFRKIELAACFLVSDELWKSQWQPGFKSKTFMAKNKQVLNCLLEAVTTKQW